MYIHIYTVYDLLHITYYILPTDCLLMALDVHMPFKDGCGP